MAFDPAKDIIIGGSYVTETMWWWSGREWREFKTRGNLGAASQDPPYESANWVDDAAAKEIVAEGNCGLTSTGRQAYSCTWSGQAWTPIVTASTPATDNPQNFSLAYYPPLRAVVAFGGDQGVRMADGDWITGGSQTWLLTHA